MENGADPNITNDDGGNALHRASFGGKLEVVKHLMENGADQNLRDNNGENALHKASLGGELEVVEYLTAKGADPKLKDNNGKTAYDHATQGSVNEYYSDRDREDCKKVMNYLQTLPQNGTQ